MHETVLDGSTRARIETIVARGKREELWTCWLLAGSSASGFEQAYKDLMRWARIDPPSALRVIADLRRRGLRGLGGNERARLVRLHAHILCANGRFVEASTYYADAIARFEREGDRTEVLRTAIGRLDVLAMLDDFAGAFALARRARPRLARLDPVLEARFAVNLGAVQHRAGKPEHAIRSYRRARRILARRGLDADVALVDFNLGQSLLLTGRIAQAERCFRASHATFEARGFTAQALRARLGVASAQVQRGLLEEGLGALRGLRSDLESAGDSQAGAALQWELSRVWGAFGETERALEESEAALRTYDRLGSSRDAAHVALLSVRWLLDLGRRSDARIRLARARAPIAALKDDRTLRRMDLELAAIHLQDEQIEAAIALLEPLQSKLDRSDRDAALECRALLAHADLRRARPASARRRALRAHREARGSFTRLHRPELAMTLAEAELALGNSRAACRWARRCVRDLEDQVRGTDDEGLRRAMWSRPAALIRDAVAIVLRNGGPSAERDALDLLVRARSRELIEALLEEMPEFSGQTRARIAMLRQELLDSSASPNPDVRASVIAHQIDRLDEELHRRLHRNFAVARRTRDRTRVRHWQREVRDHAVVVYERLATGWFAFVVEDGHVRAVDLELDDTRLHSCWRPLQLLFEAAAAMPTSRRQRFLERTCEEATTALGELGRALWARLDIRRDRVHLVLPKQMQEMPVEAAGQLYFTASPKIFSRWPHPALIRTDAPVRRGTAVLLHDGSPGRKSEIATIARELDRHAIPTVEGTDRSGLDSATSIGLFHVAAHGVASRGHWIGTGILLDDGWLGLERIAGDRRYRDGTLFFASCASGQECLRPQGSFDGWAAAGLGSGAREIIVALWRIDDRGSKAFTRAFYVRWANGMSAAEASAEVRARAIARGHHPFNWASFSVVG